MPLYLVSGSFRGYFTVGVEANSEEEAVEAVDDGLYDEEIAKHGLDLEVEEVECTDDEEDDDA